MPGNNKNWLLMLPVEDPLGGDVTGPASINVGASKPEESGCELRDEDAGSEGVCTAALPSTMVGSSCSGRRDSPGCIDCLRYGEAGRLCCQKRALRLALRGASKIDACS